MPQCVAFGCNNRTDGKHNDPPDVSFHSFPLKNTKRVRAWLRMIGRSDFKPSRASRLCSKHFLPSAYEEDLFAKYVGLQPGKKPRRILKDDTVPTEFCHRPSASETAASEFSARSVRLKKRRKEAKVKEMKEMLVSATSTSPGCALKKFENSYDVFLV
ncbi:THAP domain-containing protein 1-like [Neoarius graeffei]|uniref:THAP domain-containing protein 1-like n=1 Tax=Neoarius graeffei TaxID=443677 RepID=UPI00298C1F6B|nr:THAP domain-containing protein 1-like [Neoarius graeffei]